MRPLRRPLRLLTLAPAAVPAAVLAVLLAAALLATGPARADAIALRRGVNFESWQTWTSRGGFLDPGYDRANFPDWMTAVSDGQLTGLRRQGFDFVRVNVDPSPFFWDPPGRPALIARTIAATRRLQGLGFRVIVDLHLVPDMEDRPFGLHTVLGTGGVAPSEAFDAYVRLVADMAAALKPLPRDATALELLNEPDQDWFSHITLTDRWPAQLKALYTAARTAAPGLTLVLSGARGGGIEGLQRISAGDYAGDPDVIWSFHLYEPYEITHSALPWEQDARHFLWGLPFPAADLDVGLRERLLIHAESRIDAEIADPAARQKMLADVTALADAYAASGMGPDALQARVAEVAAWARDNGVPPARILMGEFGVFQDHVERDTRAAVLEATRKAAESAGFSWAVYTAGLTQAGRSFSVIGDNATLALDPEVAAALGLQ